MSKVLLSPLLCSILLTLLFTNCTSELTENSDKTNGWNYNDSEQSCLPSDSVSEIPAEFDVKISMYFSDELFEDSTFSGTTWYKNDTSVYTEGKQISNQPNAYYIEPFVIKKANGKKILETFDENICETGGRSAWNKYILKYDKQSRPVQVEHYKAWWYEGLMTEQGEEPEIKPEKPDYFLNAIVTYCYDSLFTSETTYFPKHELTDVRTTTYNKHSRIILETYQTKTYKQKFYFEYPD
ncbi:MAG: hypothetical protein IPM77_06205 [Crocinitomicaceae bacterium]|nr:hypothetical protein [Crocinitomicaceae bacterium]